MASPRGGRDRGRGGRGGLYNRRVTDVDSLALEVLASLPIEETAGPPVRVYNEKLRNKTLQTSFRDTSPGRRKPPKEHKAIQPTYSQGKKLGLFDLTYCVPSHQVLHTLHTLWTQYITELMKHGYTDEDKGKKISTADWHGAIATVLQHKNPNLVGRCGIIVQETRAMLRVAYHPTIAPDKTLASSDRSASLQPSAESTDPSTAPPNDSEKPRGKLVSWPKEGGRYELSCPGLKCIVNGRAIVQRPSTRSKAKWKTAPSLVEL